MGYPWVVGFGLGFAVLCGAMQEGRDRTGRWGGERQGGWCLGVNDLCLRGTQHASMLQQAGVCLWAACCSRQGLWASGMVVTGCAGLKLFV